MDRDNNERVRGRITHVGTVSPEGEVSGWGFDCMGQAVAIEILDNGQIAWCGWTIDALRRISEEHRP